MFALPPPPDDSALIPGKALNTSAVERGANLMMSCSSNALTETLASCIVAPPGVAVTTICSNFSLFCDSFSVVASCAIALADKAVQTAIAKVFSVCCVFIVSPMMCRSIQIQGSIETTKSNIR